MTTAPLYQIEVFWREPSKPKENYIFPEGTDFDKVRNEFDLLISVGDLGSQAHSLVLWSCEPGVSGWKMVDDYEFA